MGMWMAFSLATVAVLWQGRIAAGMLTFAFGYGVVLSWWRRLVPPGNLPWADEVSRIVSGTLEGDRATLRNVRNFDWRSNTDYTPRWETRVYDLNRLDSVDMIMSYWTGPSIAHMLISFGFEETERVAFSVEVRRDKRESYSELGGFFKKFELSIIAADERDVIRVRTNVRGEDVYLYRLRMPRRAMRELFASYLKQAERLIATPRFYNTVTANCATLVYQMMKQIIGRLPLDYRVVLTGRLPAYVHRVGGLDQRYTLEELRELGHITARARQSGGSETFSTDIRRGIPALDAADLPS